MSKQYQRIEGDFVITDDGKFFIGERELEDYDIVHLTITTLKKIIADSKLQL